MGRKANGRKASGELTISFMVYGVGRTGRGQRGRPRASGRSGRKRTRNAVKTASLQKPWGLLERVWAMDSGELGVDPGSTLSCLGDLREFR